MTQDIFKKLNELGIEVDENSPSMLAYWDKDLKCRYANNAYWDWFGVKPIDMVDKISLPQLIGPLYVQNLPYIQGVLNGKVQVFTRDITTVAGDIKKTVTTYCPDFHNENVEGFFVHVEDMAPKNFTHSTLKEGSLGYEYTNFNEQSIINVQKALYAFMLKPFPGIPFLAKQNFVSESRLKRDFKARYNKTIFHYYRHIQMELADAYIKDKKCSKKQMADLLNFSNPSKFNTCYKNYLKEKADLQLINDIKKASDDRYKTFITQSPFAIAMLDTQMMLMAASQKFLADYHIFEGAVVGIHFYKLFPDLDQKWKTMHKAALKGKTFTGEDTFFERSNGSHIWIKWDIRPWRKENATIGGLLIFTEDVTAIKLKEQENAKILEILNKASEIVRIGAWKRNFKTNTSTWNHVIKEILEVPVDYTPQPELALTFYKKGKSRELMKKCLQEATDLGKTFDVNVDLITAKGNQKKVRVVGYPEFINGKCERLFGILQELSPKKSSF
ncbi:hypothetical protein A0256_20125 [Mucilaginibacter sp. PAMC 26640]|nr:hypothetical protein A0256_20125 [Mucilaginibacter sp. PAMC 26640]